MAQGKIRVRLKSSDSTIIDAAAAKVVDVAKRNGSKVSGPIPLPTDREIVTILRAVHKYKDSREQFEMRTHKRLIDILDPAQKTVEALMSIELPAGVEIEIKAESNRGKPRGSFKSPKTPHLVVMLAGSAEKRKFKACQPITNGGKNEKRHYR